LYITCELPDSGSGEEDLKEGHPGHLAGRFVNIGGLGVPLVAGVLPVSWVIIVIDMKSNIP
jgi:hypothetical protein